MKRRLVYLLIILLSVVGVIAVWNYFTVQRFLSQAIADDSRNSGIKVFAHYQWFVNPQILIFDLQEVSGDKSATDVSRTLLQFAEKMQSKKFKDVVLSYKGSARFMMKGDYFHTLGTEYNFQNPIYTLRTLPEKVYNLDGTPAFSTWTGGLFGVLGKQLEDLNEFHKRWYLADVTGGN
jgi:hypothetical protein